MKERRIIRHLKRQFGPGFVAKVMLEHEGNLIGDSWVQWGNVDVIRSVYNYMKQLFQTVTTYVSEISWQSIMEFTNVNIGMPVFEVLNLIQQLGEMSVDAAKAIACQFITSSVNLFAYLKELILQSGKNTTQLTDVDELAAQLSSCETYMSQLGGKAIEFIQWIAKKMKTPLELFYTTVQTIFDWTGDIIANIAEQYRRGQKVTTDVAKQGLRVGIFSVSLLSEVASWTGDLSADISTKAATLSKIGLEHITEFLKSLVKVLGSNSVASALVSAALSASGVLARYWPTDGGFARALRAAGTGLVMVAQLVQNLISWMAFVIAFPGRLVVNGLSAIGKRMLGPIANFVGEKFYKLFPQGDEPIQMFEGSLADAENVNINIAPSNLLRDAIADAKILKEQFRSAVQEQTKKHSLSDRVQTAWIASDGLMRNLTGGDLTTQHRRAVSRVLGPIAGLADQLTIMRLRLMSTIIASILKASADEERSAVTTEEDDELFAKIWLKNAQEINAPQDDPSFWHRYKLAVEARRYAALSAIQTKIDNAVSDGQRELDLELKARVSRHFEEYFEAIKKAQENRKALTKNARTLTIVLCVMAGFGGLTYLYIDISNRARKEIQQLADMEHEYRKIALDTPAVKNFQNIAGRNFKLTPDSAESLAADMKTWINELPDHQVIDRFDVSREILHLDSSLKDRVEKLTTTLKHRKNLAEIDVSAEGIPLTSGLDYTLNFLSKKRLSRVDYDVQVEQTLVAEVKDLLVDATDRSIAQYTQAFSDYFQKKTSENLLSIAWSSIIRYWRGNAVSNVVLGVSTGNTFLLSSGFATASASLIVPVGIVIILMSFIAILADLIILGSDHATSKFLKHSANTSIVVNAYYALTNGIYGWLEQDAKKVGQEWKDMIASLPGLETVQALTNILALFNPNTYLGYATTAASIVGRGIIGVASPKMTTSEQAIKELEAFEQPFDFEKDPQSNTAIAYVPMQTPQTKVACDRCQKEAAFACADCKTTMYCSQHCGNEEQGQHFLTCALFDPIGNIHRPGDCHTQ